MIAVTVHSADGTLLRAMEVASIGDVLLNLAPDEGFILGRHRVADGFARDGVFVPFPTPRPGPWARFEPALGTWVDTRTPDDLAAELRGRRSAASLTKVAFIQSAMAAGLLTPAEALAAAQGSVPAPFAGALQSMPAEAQDMAPIIWAGATRIDRLDPLISAIAAAAGIPDALLDQIFGVEA